MQKSNYGSHKCEQLAKHQLWAAWLFLELSHMTVNGHANAK